MEDGKLLKKTLTAHWWDLSPMEAKIFITLYWFADPGSCEVSLSVSNLSNRVNLKPNLLIPNLEKLVLRELIMFKQAEQQSLDSYFKILFEKKPHDIHNQDELFAKIVEPIDESSTHVNDNVIIKNNNKSLNVNGNVPGEEKKSPDDSQVDGSELTARQIAKTFGDEKNIALYEAYVNSYSREVILKAYHQVLQTPHHRIKKSPGAYFTFLVGRYGGKIP